MKSLIIWGTGSLAEMARYYAEQTGFKVAAHVVDPEFFATKNFQGSPVIPATELKNFPPTSHDAFVAIGYGGNNSARTEKCHHLQSLKYSLISIKSETAVVNTNTLSPNTLVMDNVIIEPFVTMGTGNIFWSGSQICHHTHIGDFNFFGPASLICGNVKIGSQNFFGGHSTVRDGISIGDRTVIGAHTFAEGDVASKIILNQGEITPFRDKSK